MSPRRRWKTAATVVAVVISGIACGTRVDTGEASSSPAQTSSVMSEVEPAIPTEAAAAGAGANLQEAANGVQPSGKSPSPEPSATPASGFAPAARSVASAGVAAASPSAPGGGRAAAPDSGPIPGVPATPPPGNGEPAQPGTTGAKSAVLVASVGTYSGLPGGTLLPILQGSQLWVRFINARGGLNGHPVRLLVYDDGADPARHRTQVQEAIERRKVVAFLTNAEVLTGKGSVDYITQKRVPVIGSETASPWFYESPMYFPQASSGDSVLMGILGNAARLMLPQGKKKMGSLACNEAQACRDAERIFNTYAEKLGFDYVYQGKASLAQPDLTAECLAARNAGVETFVIVMETSSVNRISSSCSRQGFKPTLSVPHSTATDDQKNNPFLDGLITGSMVFPYFQDTTPATREFQQATKTYRANLATGIALATGWVSGKLLEKAGRDLPEPPTSNAILKNLYALKGETLDGLTMPLTFTEGQPPAPLACWFDLMVRNKSWITPDDFTLHCL